MGKRRAPGLSNHIQILAEVLTSVRAENRIDSQRLEIARQSLDEVRRHTRILQDKIALLEENKSS